MILNMFSFLSQYVVDPSLQRTNHFLGRVFNTNSYVFNQFAHKIEALATKLFPVHPLSDPIFLKKVIEEIKSDKEKLRTVYEKASALKLKLPLKRLVELLILESEAFQAAYPETQEQTLPEIERNIEQIKGQQLALCNRNHSLEKELSERMQKKNWPLHELNLQGNPLNQKKNSKMLIFFDLHEIRMEFVRLEPLDFIAKYKKLLLCPCSQEFLVDPLIVHTHEGKSLTVSRAKFESFFSEHFIQNYIVSQTTDFLIQSIMEKIESTEEELLRLLEDSVDLLPLEDPYILNCGHTFSCKTIEQLKKTCPLCRKEIQTSKRNSFAEKMRFDSEIKINVEELHEKKLALEKQYEDLEEEIEVMSTYIEIEKNRRRLKEMEDSLNIELLMKDFKENNSYVRIKLELLEKKYESWRNHQIEAAKKAYNTYESATDQVAILFKNLQSLTYNPKH